MLTQIYIHFITIFDYIDNDSYIISGQTKNVASPIGWACIIAGILMGLYALAIFIFWKWKNYKPKYIRTQIWSCSIFFLIVFIIGVVLLLT